MLSAATYAPYGHATSSGLEAVDEYRDPSQTRMQYQFRGGVCGTVLRWTRCPG